MRAKIGAAVLAAVVAICLPGATSRADARAEPRVANTASYGTQVPFLWAAL